MRWRTTGRGGDIKGSLRLLADGLPQSGDDLAVFVVLFEKIQHTAMSISAIQDAPVFSAPPLVREPAALSTEASEPAYLPQQG